MSRRRLLVAIVDDEEPVRRALRRLFLSAGIDVETFASGYEFLGSVKTQPPDCAVLDLHLPGLTGLDVLERLAEANVRVPTVVVTGHDQAGLAEKALAAGASIYLRKPLDEQSLLDSVAAAVRESELTSDGARNPS
jgi:FixJ family two-component response regulator